MKAIIQRVMKASVTVGERVTGSINRGLCVLIGIHRDDTEKEMDYIVRKILNTKLFSDTEEKRWMKSVTEMDFEIICISQFTLEAYHKGNKLEFSKAMSPDPARIFYNKTLDMLKSRYKPEKIKDGAFGEYMQVHIQNDGPVTIPIERVSESVKVKDKSKNSTPAPTANSQDAANSLDAASLEETNVS